MTNKDHTSKPSRRKSDLTLLGSSSQDLDDWVYTLEFGANLEKTSFEGLNNYSVANTRTDKKQKKAKPCLLSLSFACRKATTPSVSRAARLMTSALQRKPLIWTV